MDFVRCCLFYSYSHKTGNSRKSEDSSYELSLEITASGNAQNLIAGSSIYSAITESDARLGGAVSLSYYGGDVEKVKLTYEIGESYISNEGSKYAENCVDMQGIKRYNIFRYFEELNMLLPVATEFDEENNTLFAETDELGTYCVLDMEVLLQTFGVNPDGSKTEQVEMQMYAGVNDGYNICFIIDIRKGVITDEPLENIKNEIIAFMSNAEDNNKRIGITICVQANSDLGEDSQSCEYVGYYTSSEELKIALDEINLVNYVGTEDKADVDFNCLVVSDGVKMMSYQSRGTNNYIFDIYSISYSFFNRSGFAENEQAIIEKNATSTGVNISFISNERKSGSYQTEIPKATGGLMIEGFTDFGKIAYNHVFEEPLVDVEKFNAILATGYQQVELDEKLNAYNGSDTDKDTLTDWVEVGGDQWIEMGLFSYDEYNNVVLPTVGQCIDALGDVPFYVEGALAENDFKGSFLNMRVMPISSDPTQEDSDEDGYSDAIDFLPLCYDNPISVPDNQISMISVGRGKFLTISDFSDSSASLTTSEYKWTKENVCEFAEFDKDNLYSTFIFKRYKNAYKICSVLNENLVLTVENNSVIMDIDKGLVNQYWFIVPHSIGSFAFVSINTDGSYVNLLCENNSVISTNPINTNGFSNDKQFIVIERNIAIINQRLKLLDEHDKEFLTSPKWMAFLGKYVDYNKDYSNDSYYIEEILAETLEERLSIVLGLKMSQGTFQVYSLLPNCDACSLSMLLMDYQLSKNGYSIADFLASAVNQQNAIIEALMCCFAEYEVYEIMPYDRDGNVKYSFNISREDFKGFRYDSFDYKSYGELCNSKAKEISRIEAKQRIFDNDPSFMEFCKSHPELSDTKKCDAFIDAFVNKNAWADGFTTQTLPRGTTLYQYVDKGQNYIGKWLTTEKFDNVSDVRNGLALTEQFKAKPCVRVEYVITETCIFNVGVVGEQVGIWERNYYPGGASQYQFLNNLQTNPNFEIEKYFKIVSQTIIGN